MGARLKGWFLHLYLISPLSPSLHVAFKAAGIVRFGLFPGSESFPWAKNASLES